MTKRGYAMWYSAKFFFRGGSSLLVFFGSYASSARRVPLRYHTALLYTLLVP